MTAPTPTSGDSGYSRFMRQVVIPWFPVRRLFRAHLILLDFTVGHDTLPNVDRLVRKMYFEQAERHSSAVLLVGLRKLCRRSQWREAAGKIFEGLLAEVTVAVVSEQGAIDLPLLQRGKDFA